MNSTKTAAIAFAATLALAGSAFAQGAGGGAGGGGGNDQSVTGAAGSMRETSQPMTTGTVTGAPSTAAETGPSSAGASQPERPVDNRGVTR